MYRTFSRDWSRASEASRSTEPEVYRARRTRLGDIVTIKVIRTRSGDARTRRRRFMAEARMCAMLHHPYIVSVLDFGVEPGVGPYLVMEYLNGPSLRQELAARGA